MESDHQLATAAERYFSTTAVVWYGGRVPTETVTARWSQLKRQIDSKPWSAQPSPSTAIREPMELGIGQRFLAFFFLFFVPGYSLTGELTSTPACAMMSCSLRYLWNA